MRPALRSGDIVLCWKIPAHAARTGDILAVPAGRRILFHRLIRRVRRESSGEWRLSLKGDAQAKTGNLSWPGHSLGRVEAAWRDGVTIPLRRGITAAVLSRFSGRLQEWMEDLARR
ncbi:MAG: S24/S26 family peptidase [Planctomycetota bacterium]